MTEAQASRRMATLGVVQADDPRLRQVAVPLDLPTESMSAQRLVVRLQATMDQIAQVHVFGKGMGLAANQIGIDRAVAVVRPAGRRSEDVILLNPEIADRSQAVDEQYEGCLSFFDVRGLVPRSLRIDVAHDTLSGHRVVSTFREGLARLVAHEIDHLDGVLYTDLMRPGVEPIDVAEYRGTGSAWSY